MMASGNRDKSNPDFFSWFDRDKAVLLMWFFMFLVSPVSLDDIYLGLGS